MLRTAATISKLSFTNFHSLINQYHYSAQQTLSILKMRISLYLSYRLESIQCLIFQNTISVLQYARKTIHTTYLAVSENAKGTRFRKSSNTSIYNMRPSFINRYYSHVSKHVYHSLFTAHCRWKTISNNLFVVLHHIFCTVISTTELH